VIRRAFSKPTHGDQEFTSLMTDFRSKGYEGLQLKMGQFMPYLDDPDGYLERWGDDPGRVSGLIYFASLEPEAADKLRETVRFADRVGSERVIFCHNHPREGVTDADLVGYARVLSDIGANAAERGIALSLHHHFDQPVMHPADFEVFFGAVDPGNVRLTIDTAHLAKSGIGDIPAFIRQFAGVIDNVHFKDYENGQWRLIGTGLLDLDGILTALRESQYDGWLCVDEESDASLATGLEVSRDWLDRHL
jgi:sugar phosphate isomerase/epimerase